MAIDIIARALAISQNPTQQFDELNAAILKNASAITVLTELVQKNDESTSQDLAIVQEQLDIGEKTISEYVAEQIAAVTGAGPAGEDKLGTVKSSPEGTLNGVSVKEDGTMYVTALSTDTLQNGSSELVFDCGEADQEEDLD